MAEDQGNRQSSRGADFTGALLAWKRRGSSNGVIMTLQIVEQAEQDHRFHRVRLALSDRQLRSMTRDLLEVARERGIDLRAKKPLHERLWRRIKSLGN